MCLNALATLWLGCDRNHGKSKASIARTAAWPSHASGPPAVWTSRGRLAESASLQWTHSKIWMRMRVE